MSESQSKDHDNRQVPKSDDAANATNTPDEAGMYSTTDSTRHLERAKEKNPEVPVEGGWLGRGSAKKSG